MTSGIPQLITAEQLAELLSVPVSWVHHRTRRGCADPIPCVRLGRYVRFDLADPELRAWLDRHKIGGTTRRPRPLRVVG